MKHNHSISDMDTYGAYITGVMRKIAYHSAYKQNITQWEQAQRDS